MTDCLMIFAKAPEKGKVKTRLQLPDSDAKALHEAFITDVLRRTEGPWERVLWTTDATHPFFQDVGVSVRAQCGPGLGERLAYAFSEMLQSYTRVVVIGTDAPHVGADSITEAFSRLAQADAVIGPSSDGGYYLLGLRRSMPALFTSDIGWGGDQVCTNTVEAARSYQVVPSMLSVDFDVDRPDDLQRLAGREDLASLSATHRVLKRLGLVGEGRMP
jgi:rSAM/selenodomain-associated transferase 1